jgi:hypothetical protein
MVARCVKGKIRWYVDPKAHLCTDHEAIIIAADDSRDNNRTRWNYKSTDWSLWSSTIKAKLQEWEDSIRASPEIRDPEKCADWFNDIIIRTAKELIPSKTI